MIGESMRRRYQGGARRLPSVSIAKRNWLLLALAVVPACFGTGYALAAWVLFPAPESTADGGVAVPRLVGRMLADAKAEAREFGLTIDEPLRISHAEEPEGAVIAQSPLAGQHLRPGGVVCVAVSAGRARAVVPDVAGLPAADAAALAELLGFSVNRRDEESRGPAGVVLRVEPAPGTERELPFALTLVVSFAPPPDPVVDSLPLLGVPVDRDTAPRGFPPRRP